MERNKKNNVCYIKQVDSIKSTLPNFSSLVSEGVVDRCIHWNRNVPGRVNLTCPIDCDQGFLLSDLAVCGL